LPSLGCFAAEILELNFAMREFMIVDLDRNGITFREAIK
jgi:hypothetical protein